MIRDMGKKKTGEQGKSNNKEEMFCLWGVWAHHLELQKYGEERRREINTKKSRVINIEKRSERKIEKDRKTIFREKRLKKEKLVEV